MREQCAYGGASGETAKRRDKSGCGERCGERNGRVERVRVCVDGRVAVSGLAACDARQSGAAGGGRRGRVVHAWAADARVPRVETAGSGVRACAWAAPR